MEIADFAAFWTLYPRKVSKIDAQKAYTQALKRGVTHEQIMASLRIMMATEWKGRKREYLPYPATFLRGEDHEERTEMLEDDAEDIDVRETREHLAALAARLAASEFQGVRELAGEVAAVDPRHPAEAEKRLSEIEARIAAIVTYTADWEALKAEVRAEMSPYRATWTEHAMEAYRERLLRRKLLERAKLPRLTLAGL